MNPVRPFYTVELFPPVSHHLISLLRELTAYDWLKSTPCDNWNVKQVALHLLGGNIGRLSSQREKLRVPDDLQETIASLFQVKDSLGRPGKKAETFAELVEWIDDSNAEWVRATNKLDADTFLHVLDWSDAQLYQHFKRLDHDAPAGISVLWAGETASLNWFDIAREYTEKWLHQQHIREAVGARELDTREFLYPALDIFLRALPHTYRAVSAPNCTALVLHITGNAGGDWSLVREDAAWALFSGAAPVADAHVTMDQDLAWRVFTKDVAPHNARSHIQIEGNTQLAEQILTMVSIMG